MHTFYIQIDKIFSIRNEQTRTFTLPKLEAFMSEKHVGVIGLNWNVHRYYIVDIYIDFLVANDELLLHYFFAELVFHAASQNIQARVSKIKLVAPFN